MTKTTLHQIIAQGSPVIGSRVMDEHGDGRIIVGSLDIGDSVYVVVVEESLPRGYHDEILNREIQHFDNLNEAIAFLLMRTGIEENKFEVFHQPKNSV